jgi:hypothetical protein
VLGVPHIELDNLHHGPNWTERSAQELQALMAHAMKHAPDGWTICGNYADKCNCDRRALPGYGFEHANAVRRVSQRAVAPVRHDRLRR